MGELEHGGTAIEFVCVVAHEVRDQSPVTIHEGHWAYCVGCGGAPHVWEAIAPTALADVQRQRHTERASNGTVIRIMPESKPDAGGDGQPSAVTGEHATSTVADRGRDQGGVGTGAKRAR